MMICTGVAGQMHEQQNACEAGSDGSVECQSLPSSNALLRERVTTRACFFNLPGEIRNAIYHYVLGGHSYHVYAYGQKSWSPGSLMDAPSESASRIKIYLYKCIIHQHNPQLEWLDEHLSCFVDGHTALPNVALLRTCKQIYYETALIPYAANAFVFIAPPSFEKFAIDILQPVQAKSIRQLEIWSPLGVLPFLDDEVSWKHWTIPQQINEYDLLSGLQDLTLNFSLYDHAILDKIDEVHKLLDIGLAASASLRKVKINVTLNEAGRPESEPEVDVQSISHHIESLKHQRLIQAC